MDAVEDQILPLMFNGNNGGDSDSEADSEDGSSSGNNGDESDSEAEGLSDDMDSGNA